MTNQGEHSMNDNERERAGAEEETGDSGDLEEIQDDDFANNNYWIIIVFAVAVIVLIAIACVIGHLCHKKKTE